MHLTTALALVTIAVILFVGLTAYAAYLTAGRDD
jgi:hypothetical protein